MTDKLIIDTNIFINSIFNPENETTCLELISKLDELDVRLLFSQNTIGELLYIVKRQANELNWEEDAKTDILHSICDTFLAGKSVNTRHLKKSEVPIIDDPDDQMFVDLAYSTKTDYIITLDEKSGLLKLTNSLFDVCTPEQYLEIIKENRQ